MSVVTTAKLSKYYGNRVGIENLDLSVESGVIFGFLGPNGAGKTTTIRLLMGLIKADRGAASVLGFDCWSESDKIKKQVGYLPGDLRLHAWMTTNTALTFFSKARGKDLHTRGQALAEFFDLDPSVRVDRMSRGMKQKLGVLLAVVHEPAVLILDEPTTALDPLAQAQLYDHLTTLKSKGHTVFFSSHILSEVEALCDRIAIVREGQIVIEDTLAAMQDRAKRRVEIRWSGDEPSTVPEFLTIQHRDAYRWSCHFDGHADRLLKWLQCHSVDDVTIAAPDLEELFHSYYERGRAE